MPVNTNGASPLLVVGLGNPGAEYEGTRHNIGAAVLGELGGHFSVNKKVNARVAEIRVGDRKVILARPRSFMNLSGGPVKALAGYFKVTPAHIVVVHDELDLDLGAVAREQRREARGRRVLGEPDLRLVVELARETGELGAQGLQRRRDLGVDARRSGHSSTSSPSARRSVRR